MCMAAIEHSILYECIEHCNFTMQLGVVSQLRDSGGEAEGQLEFLENHVTNNLQQTPN